MANVLILSLVFPPDSVSTAQIMGELSTDLMGRGHHVTVITTLPHYNRDPEAESKQPISNHWGPLLRKSNYKGIQVYHTLMPRKGKSAFLRLIAWIGFHIISSLAGMSVIPKPDVILAPSPPLTVGLVAWGLGLFYRVPFIYNVQEIYPDIAISLGALRNKFLIGLLFRLERFVYSRASRITVIAPRMRQNLLEKGVLPERVQVVPNFVDTDDLFPLPKDNEFSRQHRVHNQFLVSYAGNMGPAQGLEELIQAADLLRNETRIHFLMLGNGVLQRDLDQRVTSLGLTNFTILPYQPYSLMPLVYGASDICLVPQASETGCEAVPSKVYRIMACARPVLASTDLNSDLAHLVSEVGCGVVVQSGRPQALAETVLDAFHNQASWQKMGRIGCKYVIENYARSVITGRYHALIGQLTAA